MHCFNPSYFSTPRLFLKFLFAWLLFSFLLDFQNDENTHYQNWKGLTIDRHIVFFFVPLVFRFWKIKKNCLLLFILLIIFNWTDLHVTLTYYTYKCTSELADWCFLQLFVVVQRIKAYSLTHYLYCILNLFFFVYKQCYPVKKYPHLLLLWYIIRVIKSKQCCLNETNKHQLHILVLFLSQIQHLNALLLIP